MTSQPFTELGLSQPLLDAVAKLGYELASPIQAEAIPLLLAGEDIIGQSQTGSGKTAAFGIPAVEKADPSIAATQILILCPTRELAVQVSEECFKLSSFKRGIRSVPIYGGQSYDRQIRALRDGTQIVIGTPGRLIDHLERGTLKLDQVRMVILDEADEMLDMGFRDDIQKILESVPDGRQLVCFSATMAKPILSLIERYSSNLKTVRIQHKALTVPTVEQSYYEIRGRGKTEVLTRLIDLHDIKLGVIFCNTQRMVDELADEMIGRGYSVDRIHGGMSQAQRETVMKKFRTSKIEFLVATDVAARGIDVDNIEVVFNYDLPWDEEDYVHRIGRTGRAGRSGKAISLVAGREIYKLQHIERYTKTKINRKQPPSIEEIEEKRNSVVFERIRATLQKGGFEAEQVLVDRLLEQGFTPTDIACALVQELRRETVGPAVASPTPSYEKEFRRNDDDRPKRPWKGGRTDRKPPGGGKPFFKKKPFSMFKGAGPRKPKHG
jgi:ATP-dependent RNA helicase DeaD